MVCSGYRCRPSRKFTPIAWCQNTASLAGRCPRINRLDRAPRLEDLHRSILRQPALGQYVRHVEMDRSWESLAYANNPPDLNNRREIREEDQKLLEVAVNQAGFKGKQYDMMMMNIVTNRPRKLMGYNMRTKSDLIHLAQALTALILSVAPNLESLAFPDISAEFETPSECYLCKRSWSEQMPVRQRLQNLRGIRCLSNKDPLLSDERFYENYDLAARMKLVGNLPTVESIRVEAIEDRHSDIDLEPRSANFKKVYIRNSNYSSGSLAEIIKSCRRLQEFKYSIGGRASVDGSYPMFVERDLLGALLYHINTLQQLEVDVDEGFTNQRPASWDKDGECTMGEDPYEKDCTEGRPTSLRDFTVMNHLRIGIKLWMALARASINKGYTTGANSEHDAQINYLMKNRDRLPLLKEIAGVEEHIPNAKSVEDPDEGEDDYAYWLH
ncbi:hypothetical protein BDV36DRAFT_295071 [Aspergillus pseudocaelatus]|uniref:Uncharacterized protein n=1 Tax=Aspergillus pseudocaelatus TaxID=1825620 RepID=A0ABQ6WNG2_9EURO|nr:hypothetical protein BDV36DRAFT_295071 [Aspergillus pseudocaelatus]